MHADIMTTVPDVIGFQIPLKVMIAGETPCQSCDGSHGWRFW
jgi:hypothetical protein